MSPSQNLYAFANLFTKFSLRYFLWFLLHFKQLSVNKLYLTSTYFTQDLQSLHLQLQILSERVSRRPDTELAMNLTLSINFISFSSYF